MREGKAVYCPIIRLCRAGSLAPQPPYEFNEGTQRLARALLPDGFAVPAACKIANVPFRLASLHDPTLVLEADRFAEALDAYRCAACCAVS